MPADYLKEIRQLLTAKFTEPALRRLCQEHPAFRPLADTLAVSDSKTDIIDKLLAFADRRLLLDTLQTLAEAHQPEPETDSGGQDIDTGGGAYVEGQINTGGGDVVGRDQVINQSGPTYNISDTTAGIASIGGTVNIQQANFGGQAPPRAPVPLQRPPRAVHFVDRKTELNKLVANLQPGHVITLCGPGGIGKSAMAAEVVWTLVPEDKPSTKFPDGIIFHSFYHRPQADLALEHIARSFGETDLRPTPREAALRILAGRQALIVLDGTEAIEQNDLRPVLEVTGGCGVLITSRRHKDAPAGWHDVTSLPPDEALELLQAWGQECAANESAARRICELVGRLPLAVRLVGRYLVEVQEQAADYLKWLGKTPLDALDQGKRREESVPLLLERSLEQVSELARQVLGVTGLLALAPFGREVVAAGLEVEPGQVGRWLGELVNYGLLLRREGRWEVSHALVHQYARERLVLPAKVVERVSAYYTNLAEEQSKQGPAGYTVLDEERGHILAVLTRGKEWQIWAPVCDLTWAVSDYLYITGHWIEWINALETGLVAARGASRRGDESTFLGNLGTAYRALGQIERAVEYHEQALAIAREIGNRHGEENNLGKLGAVYRALGQIERAVEYHEQALAIAREIGDRHGEENNLGKLGAVYNDLGQVERAIEYYEQALVIAREIGDWRGEGNHLDDLGIAYRDLGQVERAVEYHEQAVAIAHEIGDQRGEENHLGNLGLAYYSLGQIEQAVEYYEQALAIARQIGGRRGEGNHLGNLAEAYHTLNRPEQAIEYYRQSLAILREVGYRQFIGYHLAGLGRVYRDLGQKEQTRQYLTEAVAYLEGIKTPNAEKARQDLAALDQQPPE